MLLWGVVWRIKIGGSNSGSLYLAFIRSNPFQTSINPYDNLPAITIL